MLMWTDTVLLRSACEDHGVPIPTAVTEAEALVEAAEALVAKIAAEVEPDPHSATAKTLAKLHAELVAWPGHDARVKTAQMLKTLADARVIEAWAQATGALLDAFRQPFNDTAARYVAAHTPHSDDPDAVTGIQQLAKVRDLLAQQVRPQLRYDATEPLTRVLVVPDSNTVLRVIPVRVTGSAAFSADWLRTVLAIDGVRLEWHTPADQQRLDATLAAVAVASNLGGV